MSPGPTPPREGGDEGEDEDEERSGDMRKCTTALYSPFLLSPLFAAACVLFLEYVLS
jgi:hypothetical protein